MFSFFLPEVWDYWDLLDCDLGEVRPFHCQDSTGFIGSSPRFPQTKPASPRRAIRLRREVIAD